MGVEIGSSNLKCLIVGEDGRIGGSASKELVTHYAYPGWAEQNPESWYTAFSETTQRALTASGIKKEYIQAVCITAATHTPVLLDRRNRPLRPAILWTDQRSRHEARWLNQTHGESIFNIAYHQANPTWTLPQLLWLQRNEPHVVQKTVKLMMPKDYLRFRLTGTWETDPTDALGTLMLDAAKIKWSGTLCAYIDWPISTLPPIRPPTHIAGGISDKAASATGLLKGTPVVVGTSDTAAESLGAGAVNPGQTIIKLATACNISVVTRAPHPDPLLFNYYHVVSNLWYTVAATNNGAATHRWMRDQFFRRENPPNGVPKEISFREMDDMASKIPLGCRGLIFHPYLQGERTPYWDPLLRGDFLGITMQHTREHFVRALYEGIAFSLLDCLFSLNPLKPAMAENRIIGGGSKSTVWRQIVSDVLGKTLLKPEIDEAAYGAALLAGIGIGMYADEKDAIKTCVNIIDENTPNSQNHDRYMELFEIYKKAQKYLVEINHRLHDFQSK